MARKAPDSVGKGNAQAPTQTRKIDINRWRRVAGKHYRRSKSGGRKFECVRPGDIVEAPAGTYSNQPEWEDLGKVGVASAPTDVVGEIPVLSFVDAGKNKKGMKVFFVKNEITGKILNDTPLTRKEAKELTDAIMARS